MAFTYDVESINKIREAGENFASVEAPIANAFEDLMEVANDSGMPALVESVKTTSESFEEGFRKTNKEMVELCEKDASLWEKLGQTFGAL